MVRSAGDLLTTLVITLLGSGFLQFALAMTRRRPEIRHLDATTRDLSIASTEKALGVVTRALDETEERAGRAEARVVVMEDKLREREGKIGELEARVDSMHEHVMQLLRELERYRSELILLREN